MASHPTQPNEQRRRLLKAASAAPVIFTLPVGGRVAAQSIYCTVQVISAEKFNKLPLESSDDYTESQQDYTFIGNDPDTKPGEEYVKNYSCWASIGRRGLPSDWS